MKILSFSGFALSILTQCTSVEFLDISNYFGSGVSRNTRAKPKPAAKSEIATPAVVPSGPVSTEVPTSATTQAAGAKKDGVLEEFDVKDAGKASEKTEGKTDEKPATEKKESSTEVAKDSKEKSSEKPVEMLDLSDKSKDQTKTSTDAKPTEAKDEKVEKKEGEKKEEKPVEMLDLSDKSKEKPADAKPTETKDEKVEKKVEEKKEGAKEKPVEMLDLSD
eukprot:gene36493-49161_t